SEAIASNDLSANSRGEPMPTFRPRTVGEYAQLFWRRRAMFFLVAAVMLISTFVVISGIPDYYQSTASVVVAGNLEDRMTANSRVATVTERLNSRAFLEPVIERHNLYSGDKSGGAMDSAVNGMRRDIKVESKYRSDTPETLTITYRNP